MTADPSPDVESLQIYWVNQFAVPPDQPGGTRHFDFATELQRRGRFYRVTSAGVRESHVHDVTITKEAPNYRVS